MEFPEQRRAIYRRNPLEEVVCQLRFPRLFILDQQVPAEFQGALGKEFPLVGSRDEIRLPFSDGIQQARTVANRTIYDFSTLDNKYTVSLCSDFLAIKANKYERWEFFKEILDRAIQSLIKNYDVPYFARIGLRYVNIIDKAAIGLGEESWTNLVRISALGLLADREVPLCDIASQSSLTLMKLDRGKVAVRSGLNFQEDDGPPRFVIDSDFFYEEPMDGAERATDLLGHYNRIAGNAFRWFITEQLHNGLEPSDA